MAKKPSVKKPSVKKSSEDENQIDSTNESEKTFNGSDWIDEINHDAIDQFHEDYLYNGSEWVKKD